MNARYTSAVGSAGGGTTRLIPPSAARGRAGRWRPKRLEGAPPSPSSKNRKEVPPALCRRREPRSDSVYRAYDARADAEQADHLGTICDEKAYLSKNSNFLVGNLQIGLFVFGNLQ
jgi:hypothetical protein